MSFSVFFRSIFSNRLFISFVRIQTYIRKLQDKNRKKNTNNKTKNVESYRITEIVNCNIATNLDDSYTNENIKNIYKPIKRLYKESKVVNHLF